MGIKVLEHKERGFNPFILISDLLPTYRVISGYFNVYLHQLCTIHGRRAIARIIRNLPLEAKKDRFNTLYDLEDVGKVDSCIGQIKREFKLFYSKKYRKWAQSMLDFIERNSKGLFPYKRFPEKEIEDTNNDAEMIFSLFKPQYKIMKQFQTPEGVQAHLNLFTLRHNFRVFPRGKRKGYSPIQLEGLNVALNDWSDLLYSKDKVVSEEALSLSERTKDMVSLGSGAGT